MSRRKTAISSKIRNHALVSLRALGYNEPEKVPFASENDRYVAQAPVTESTVKHFGDVLQDLLLDGRDPFVQLERDGIDPATAVVGIFSLVGQMYISKVQFSYADDELSSYIDRVHAASKNFIAALGTQDDWSKITGFPGQESKIEIASMLSSHQGICKALDGIKEFRKGARGKTKAYAERNLVAKSVDAEMRRMWGKSYPSLVVAMMNTYHFSKWHPSIWDERGKMDPRRPYFDEKDYDSVIRSGMLKRNARKNRTSTKSK